MGKELDSLPVLPGDEAVEGQDWLVHPIDREAGVYRSAEGKDLILSNGLIRRTFRLSPNAATVGFDNLMTGESIIRGVKPEGRVTLDGKTHDIGGLKGQPNYAFLRPQWIDELVADPLAMVFTGFEVGEPQERMAWKQVRHHAPDAEWPPKGVYLRMDYAMPEPTVTGEGVGSGVGREVLLEDSFATLDKKWREHASKAHSRCSFQNEGKVGEIYTPANTAVLVERDLPKGTRLVETVINTGTDKSASWGPGLALVWKNHVIKFNVRPGGPSHYFGLFDGVGERYELGADIDVDLGKPVCLRLRLAAGKVHAEVRQEGMPWTLVDTVVLPENLGDPKAVRVGKMDTHGGDSDFSTPGGLVRLHVERFAAYSELDESALADELARMKAKRKVRVSMHYELYDGAPILSKWMTVHNDTDEEITVDSFTCEILAAVEFNSYVEHRGVPASAPNLHVETDYAFSGMCSKNTSRFSVHWVADPEYSSQVNYARQTPCLLEVRPTMGPAVSIKPGASFESFRAFILVRDSFERERNGLAQRRMYRLVAPWITENPLMMHVRYAKWDTVKAAIDQCAEVGFEMVILTFGSGFNIEDDSPEYLAKMREYADYARSKGVEIGGYSLLASRSINAENDVVVPEGQSPTFGHSPCLLSGWGMDYFRKLYAFYPATGFMLLEHDGSYPGDVCASTVHPGHAGLADSRWRQWRCIADFYQWCRGQGIYLNVPDYYYVTGTNKSGMGYRETNWSLPRDQQVIHTRQNIYDGTWEKTPSMGWMFVPLTQYHGGGAAATIEPLDEHLDHYERMLVSNLAMGVQACYRGPRLYDTDRTKAMVAKWVAWFKEYRDILESDLVHCRRADGRDIDWMLHCNPRLERKGMLVVFNPLTETVTRDIGVNLYYTGLEDKALVRAEGGPEKEYPIARDYSVRLNITVPARGFTWFVVE